MAHQPGVYMPLRALFLVGVLTIAMYTVVEQQRVHSSYDLVI